MEERIQEYEEEGDAVAGSFNLLALCHSPSDELRRQLADNTRQLILLDQTQEAKSGHEWRTLTEGGRAERAWLDGSNAEALREYRLGWEDVDGAEPPPAEFVERLSRPNFGPSEALDLLESLEEEQRRLRAEYTAELAIWDEDAARVAGRKKDYSAAINAWLGRLARNGSLQGLANPDR